jgi:hypothetical protein
VIEAGLEEDLAVSHGVFVSHGGKLWAFHGAYYNPMVRIHTRAYPLDESTGEWIKYGVVLENGFWALNQPLKMRDGNWISPASAPDLIRTKAPAQPPWRSVRAVSSPSGTLSAFPFTKA